MQRASSFIQRFGPDAAMAVAVLIWGVQFIVMKDAFNTLQPLTYNAIRFTVGLPLLMAVALRRPRAMRLARQDILPLIVLGLIGQLGYQVFSVLALQRTTGTIVSLLIATVPTWTATLSIILGLVLIRRVMLLGLGLSLAGVALVVLSSAAEDVGFSSADLAGVALALGAALVAAIFTIRIKPFMDCYGPGVIAPWTYLLTTVGLLVLAAPDLRTLGPADIPPRIWPHIFYSGVLSSALGYLLEGYAIRHLGPARMTNYYNVTPIVTAIAGVLALGEPLTLPLIAGGALTLTGVAIVRRHTLLRPPRPLHAPASAPDLTPAREAPGEAPPA